LRSGTRLPWRSFTVTGRTTRVGFKTILVGESVGKDLGSTGDCGDGDVIGGGAGVVVGAGGVIGFGVGVEGNGS
jgi:hypothetical protein